ncbi:MAG: IseA DL-endopeptidase inhibitor family protein [Alicyclobacillus macrosporangiidus]|uniref:DL-endopeptidase inhibitor IseA family protein n=1 Tax=Alicyclobacillus macrosporangiidus TaxID=392015 RepID=UPI0026ED0B39|nr:DL-endopeptidase inhibitor IseA family protein [Alicyclobacillus macrosporangiidus]MCL6597677.1 IseA DL-endopeptidase inhibitor family protein [Alicyclobacillus macrosporangiidus]
MKRWTAGVVTIAAMAMLAGCGTATGNASNSAANATAGAGSSAVTDGLKQTFVSVNAAAHSAMQDLHHGSTIDGPMDQVKIGGQTFDLVAKSKQDLDKLKARYLDFFTPSAIDEMFKDVQLKDGQYVISESTATDEWNWYKAKVSDVKDQGDGTYVVTFDVPSQDGSKSEKKQALMAKDSSGKVVFAGDK